MSDINPKTVESILQQGEIERFKAYADGSLVVDYCCGCWHHERRGWQIGCRFHEGMEFGIERLQAEIDALTEMVEQNQQLLHQSAGWAERPFAQSVKAMEMQAEIERLQAAGAVLAKAVATYCDDEAWADRVLTAWEEARRG